MALHYWPFDWSELLCRGPITDGDCQQKFFKLPVLLFFSAISAFYIGWKQSLILRNSTQLWMIHLRAVVTLFLAAAPAVRCCVAIIGEDVLLPIDIMFSCYEAIAWIVHFGFLLSFRSHGSGSGYSARGPISLLVLWLLLYVLTVPRIFAVGSSDWLLFIPHTIYGLTLLPGGKAVLIGHSGSSQDERQALLGSSTVYVRFQPHPDDNQLGPADDRASIFSRLIFGWVNPLIRSAVDGRLQTVDDLFALPESISLARITSKFQQSVDQSKTLFRALHSTFGREFYLIGVLRLLADASGFAGPLLLGALLRQSETTTTDAEEKATYQGIVNALLLFGSSLVAAFCSVHFNWRISLVTLKMRVAMVSGIYQKSLEASGLRSSRPEVLNLMSTDTDRIINSCISFHSFWSIPLQLFVSLYLLYTQVGAALIAGLIFAVALIPVNKWIATRIGRLSERLMTAKDARLELTAETLSGAKQIKLNAWEDIFMDKIAALRTEEVKQLTKRKYLDALCVYFWATTPVLMCLLTFGVAAIQGQPLTAATAYTSVALLNMLISPLNAFPWVLNGLIEAWVSLKRVQELFDLPNIDLSEFYEPVHIKKSKSRSHKPLVLSIQDGAFVFQQTTVATGQANGGEEFRLDGVNIEVKRGDLVCITGPVGTGKSALLAAITGDMQKVRGVVALQDFTTGFGYVPQHAWVQRGTIRTNIVWGQAFDEARYRSIINACCLGPDFEQMPRGDLTFVGDKGMTLSGGQRMRIALARAIYQDKHIYLLDDLLACLDAHVANAVIEKCIFGLLAQKTRLIVTSNRSVIRRADQLFQCEADGRLVVVTPASDNEWSDYEDDEYYVAPPKSEPRTGLATEQNSASVLAVRKIYLLDEQEPEQHQETKESGHLKRSTLATYWTAISNRVAIGVLVSVFLMQASRNISDVILAQWVHASNQNGANNSTNGTANGLFEVYTGLAVANSLITLVRSFLFAYAGLRAAIIVHGVLLKSVVRAKFKFFDVTPVGRMLNRFSSDTYTIDDSLPFILNIFLAQFFGLMGALITTLYALPWIGVVIVPILPVYLSIQQRYRHAARDMKRLASNALSPVYTHFTETLEGLTIIRAFRQSGRFHRDFLVKLENSIRAQLTATAGQQWLAIRLQLLGSVLVGGCALVAVFSTTHLTNPSYVGLAISYALSITSLLSGVLSSTAETETEMVAIERVEEYSHLEPEEEQQEKVAQNDGANDDDDPEVVSRSGLNASYGWPCQGVVKFDNVTMQYAHEEESATRKDMNALHQVSFATEACGKVGIVGRTGAGKTSIFSALLRTHPIQTGAILIDAVNVNDLPLAKLRERVAYVVQDPFLFRGTIRENLDPRNAFYDSDIWGGISRCLCLPLVRGLGGLEGRIEADSLSAGQKQLLCLVRAFLKQAKVLCIDEGTAHLDVASESCVQTVIRHAFRSSTVIQVAHRLQNVTDVDEVLVMAGGQVVEAGHPKQLQRDPHSHFSEMLAEQKTERL